MCKCMGTHLRKSKQDVSATTMTKTGKSRISLLVGKGRLTDDVIGALQSYYEKAIWDNADDDVTSMRKAVWGSFFHLSSNDNSPGLTLCPNGEDSWCFYNRALAKRETPPHFTKNLYLARLDFESLMHIKQVYWDLSSPELLKRCLSQRSQNPNKSLHAKVWQKCLKIKHAGFFIEICLPSDHSSP